MLATMLMSHAGDDIAGVTWPQRDIDLSHPGDNAAEATLPWRNIDAESCWRQCCLVLLMMTLPG
jgi:hypothetical protein